MAAKPPDICTLPEFCIKLPVVTDLSLSALGGQVALATRYGAVVADLDNADRRSGGECSWSRVATSAHAQSAFRVAFNPHPRKESTLAVASGRNISIVDLNAGRGSTGAGSVGHGGNKIGTVERDLSAHVRTVNALDWNPNSGDLLATCAEDNRFFIWDVRQQPPAQSLLSPASWTCSVRWAKLRESHLATGHEDTVCVWDWRNSSQPMRVLAPGQSRVLSVDWSHHDENKLLSVSARQGATAASSGSISIWDVNYSNGVHDSIEIAEGMPGAARFLPFGPAILASVDSVVVVFSLQEGRKAQLTHTFNKHNEAVSALDFAARGGGTSDWRFVSVSPAERQLIGWKHHISEKLQETIIKKNTDVASLEPRTPKLQARDTNYYLGSIANQAKKLKALRFVEDCFSGKQAGEEYFLSIEVKTNNLICFCIKISIDPSDISTKRQTSHGTPMGSHLALSNAEEPDSEKSFRIEIEKSLRVEIQWKGEWAGTSDGPLVPGIIEETFKNMSITGENILRHGDDLARCIEALVCMLERRDTPPALSDSAADNAPKAPTGVAKRRKTDELPFPRTCGTCWSPQGDLLYFCSLQKVSIPFPREWSFTDYGRLLKIHREMDLRTFFDDDDPAKHSEVASNMRVDPTVHIVPSSRLSGLVEDNWWTSSLTSFNFEPSPSEQLGELCRHNAETVRSLGREDLAEVWNLLAFFMEELSGNSGGAIGGSTSPFIVQLVRQVIKQLFDAQETLILAMVGLMLARASSFHSRLCDGLEDKQYTSDADVNFNISESPEVPTLDDYAAYGSLSWSPLMEISIFDAPTHKTKRSKTAEEGTRRLTRNLSSPDSTISEPVPWRAPSRQTTVTLPAETVRTDPLPPFVRPLVDKYELPKLLPHDTSSMQCLLYSAHAHCDLFHRLGEFRASRALARLLKDLRAHHELPLLNVDIMFGGSRLESAEEDSTTQKASNIDRSIEDALLQLPCDAESQARTNPPGVQCAVCCERVRTLYMPCLSCNHGFHISCFRYFFTDPDQTCPAIGCNCRCVRQRPID